MENDKAFVVLKRKLTRDVGAMLNELIASNQPWRVYPTRIIVDMPSVRSKAAAAEAVAEAVAEAARKAKEAAEKETGK